MSPNENDENAPPPVLEHLRAQVRSLRSDLRILEQALTHGGRSDGVYIPHITELCLERITEIREEIARLTERITEEARLTETRYLMRNATLEKK